MKEEPEAGWTTVSELRSTLQRRWQGTLLKAYAAGEPFTPFSVPVQRPAEADLLERRERVQSWLTALVEGCAPSNRRPGLRIEVTRVTGRRVGHNELPRRVWVDSYAALAGWLGVTREVAQLDRLLDLTASAVPELADWARAHPRTVLEQAGIWERVLASVSFIRDHDQYLYLRQVDVPGVDTKFLEQNRVLLGRLLDVVLPAARVDVRFGGADFAARYRFRRRPDYTRLRSLGTGDLLPGGLSELTVRTEELARLEIGVRRVVMVENEISYLALPDVPDAVAIFGSGFALGSVAALSWLPEKSITYWGDLDTYGFVILSRLRARYPEVTSVLMDTETLLAHPQQWVVEEKPTDLPLGHLSEPEAALYADLVEDRYGHHIRLEQERISYARVLAAFAG